MVIPVLAIVKLPLFHIFKLSPLLWPFNLYLPSPRNISSMFSAISETSSFFAFRLWRILSVDDHDHGDRPRWERAARLFFQELLPRRSQQRPNNLDEDRVHSIFAFAL